MAITSNVSCYTQCILYNAYFQGVNVVFIENIPGLQMAYFAFYGPSLGPLKDISLSSSVCH